MLCVCVRLYETRTTSVRGWCSNRNPGANLGVCICECTCTECRSTSVPRRTLLTKRTADVSTTSIKPQPSTCAVSPHHTKRIQGAAFSSAQGRKAECSVHADADEKRNYTNKADLSAAMCVHDTYAPSMVVKIAAHPSQGNLMITTVMSSR